MSQGSGTMGRTDGSPSFVTTSMPATSILSRCLVLDKKNLCHCNIRLNSTMRLLVLMLLVQGIRCWTPQGRSDDTNFQLSTSRRQWLGTMIVGGCAGFLGASPCEARDELFQSNPLTNPLLEQIRIWDQAQADELKYGGELAPGDAGNRGKTDAYTSLLLPILKVDLDLAKVNAAVQDRSQWKHVQEILAAPAYDKVAFKKTFNAYGDNIYYSDPERANLYLGGGALPRNEQSLAYLLRNEILTTVEALRAEINYLVKDTSGGDDGADLVAYAKHAAETMQQYLNLVPPDQLKAAREMLANERS